MRISILVVVCVFVAAPTSMAMGQEVLDFSFDYEAYAGAYAYGESDSDTQINASAAASASYESPGGLNWMMFASAWSSAGTDATGLWMDTHLWMDSDNPGAGASATATIDGVFSIRGIGDVDFSAVVVPTGNAADPGWWPHVPWTLQVWDEADPGTILIELDESNPSAETVLTGGTDYGVSLSHSGESVSYNGGLEAQFTAEGTPIPEPATMGLLALGGVALLRRRRG